MRKTWIDRSSRSTAKASIGTLAILLALLLAWTAPATAGKKKWLPVSFATTTEAFAPLDKLASVSGVPAESFKTSTFPVPFEDVYGLAVVSLAQAQLFQEQENKALGVILASRTVQAMVPFPWCVASGGNARPLPRNYHYAVVVKEKGPRETEVRIMAKAQGKCDRGNCWAGGGTRKKCIAYSTLHWPQGEESTEPELKQFLIFVRNNLLASGLL